MSKLSVVVPAYNESDVVAKTAITINRILKNAGITHEIVFVDDGSTDHTWKNIESLCAQDINVLGVKLSRNFGKESAILAGLSHAKGSAIAIIDCDLQHPPDLLVDMFRIWAGGGVDIVEGVKLSRGHEGFVYRGFANLFNCLVESLCGIKLKDSSDFKLLDRRVVDIIVNMPERQRFFRALSSWIGYNRVEIPFCVESRMSGNSKFNFRKSAIYALTNIASFSSAPMQLVTFIGVGFSAAAFVMGIHTLLAWILHRAVEGFTTVILLLLIIGSMLMISLGIIGFYIGKIYEEIKFRPPYLVEIVTGGNDMTKNREDNIYEQGITKQNSI